MYLGSIFGRRVLAAGVAVGALAVATHAFAVDSGAADSGAAATAANAAGPASATTTEGVEVREVIVTVEANKAAAAAPSKGNLNEVQPESIVTRKFMELATQEDGNWTTVALIAPSLGGITSNGGGVGEYNKMTLRGFQDGQYNLTYDGIAFADTNDPTHHANSYWPSSTIGTVVVDRGPGAAGDLGQANFGGAVHLFSPVVEDKFGGSQKVTYGSFNTQDYVTTLNTGSIAQLGDAKFLVNFEERSSDGELSYSGGEEQNQLFKAVVPIGEHYSLTFFGSSQYTQYYEADANTGETWAQVQRFGKNFALNNDPKSEHYYGFNPTKKHTDFEYIDFKGEPGWGVTIDDQLYSYFYSNKTIATNDVSGVDGPDANFALGGTTNLDAPKPAVKNSLPSTDIDGYNKGNRYRVAGDILRVNKAWSFGTLKLGALGENATTDRHNYYMDWTQGVPDNQNTGALPNYTLAENSSWHQYQLFADFELHPLANLTITPGIKYVDFTREVDGLEKKLSSGAKRMTINGSEKFDKTLYFGTINYKVRPYWSVYGQYATGFLIPSLSQLYVPNVTLNDLKPQQSVNWQLGSVYTRGHITLDADVYTIRLTNYAQLSPNKQYYFNSGTANYSGVEAEGAYAFDNGLSFFANGSLNAAKNVSSNQEEPNAPKWTLAAGAMYRHGPWEGALTYKQVGKQAYNLDSELPAYDTINLTGAYDFGHFRVKLSAINLADSRSITSFSGTTLYSSADSGFYSFQAGRELMATVQAKF
jgi:iron complex outermembrane receptor protein